jgi:hypothetical protein
MFTLLVSWLLAALVPGLLMLATLGLGRLERELAHDAVVAATDVAEFLDHAEAVDVHTLATEGMPEALDYLHRRQAQQLLASPAPGRHARPDDARPLFAGAVDDYGEATLPTRTHNHSRANPQVAGTRHVNRV